MERASWSGVVGVFSDAMAAEYSWRRDQLNAARERLLLNKLGRKTGKGHRWTSVAVRTARRLHRIAGPRDTVCDPEILSMQAAARYTETSDTTIKKLVDVGCLSMVQIAPFAPWEIRRSELDSEPVRTILEGLRRTGRLEIPDTSIRQPDLFQ